jgi:hypothetical protein
MRLLDLVLAEVDDIVAWCPWATPERFVVRIAPRRAALPFVTAGASTLRAAARVLRLVLRSLRSALGAPPYNVILYVDAARGTAARRWRIEVVPRLVAAGGFERGSGMSTNADDPRCERDALREHWDR